MRPLARLALALTGTLTCADEPTLEPVPLGEVCGQQGPVRLLELPPGRQLTINSLPFRLGDRRYFRTSSSIIGDDGNPKHSDHEVWSTGLCGESPRPLADVLYLTSTNPTWPQVLQDQWPDLLIGCRSADNEFVLLDPDGAQTPLMPPTTCLDRWTEHGTVAFTRLDHDTLLRDLWLHPYPGDPHAEPPPPRLLHPALRVEPAIADPAIKPTHIITIHADAVFALDADDKLLRIDIATSEVTTEAEDVLAFRISADERYLLWQHTALPPADPSYTPSAVILHDRMTGTSVALGELSLATTGDPFKFVDHDILHLYVTSPQRLRVFHLPGLEFVDLWPDRFEAVLADGRWLLSNAKDIKLYDEADDFAFFVIQAEGHILARDEQRILHLARDVTRADTQGPVHHVPFADLEARRFAAPRATKFAQLDGSRLVTPVDLDSDGRGELLLVDLDTADEQRIDTHVPAASFRLDAGFGPGHVVYSVDDGDRSGIYVAHLPPSE